ncbi:FHA domain-containing protein [[Phormidium] sp. ETS-05]|uniref:FHA domain-containing protein n=1 Tax=[Phormidium] sp. ETS-05 TaxID=222819 RepID=UPI0018EF2A3F|nr:FHA domain-containing protein [[Phormidium] sp. ETS-05]
MIVCPNCNHQNPDGATACEACYTPLPATTNCPNCGATVQTDATFCGQCGYNLQPQSLVEEEAAVALPATAVSVPPELGISAPELEISAPPPPPPLPEVPAAPPVPAPVPAPVSAPAPAATGNAKTQLQVITARVLHVQTNTQIELPPGLPVIHLGKPNDRVPPDIDVAGFPNSEVVSRIHADIRVEGDAFYIEDVGSSNGTYINNLPLPPGNRHRLRPGDRISLGKGDMVSFIFQMS